MKRRSIIFAMAACLLFSACVADPPATGPLPSLEYGHETAHNDYCAPMDLPEDFGNGALFSVWTRITVAIEAGGHRGNMNVFFLDGEGWNLICLVGNILFWEDGSVGYNANTMLGGADGAWIGDFCGYRSLSTEGISLEEANGWVWAAWQVVLNGDDTMTLRQWIKFGIDGLVHPAGLWSDTDGPGEELVVPGGTTLELMPVPASFDPGPFLSFRLGDDNTWSGENTPSNSYLCHARMEARSDAPGLEELDAIARASAPDGSAWGDWELVWRNGAADLSDRSGHGHHLSLMPGGALHEGLPSPVFP